jgi:hypothetical protein
MQRSRTQVIYRYLPGSLFFHDEGFIANVDHVIGRPVSLNKMVLLDELATELERWHTEQVGIPDPRTRPDEYITIEPEAVTWDVYPLTFECVRQDCRRIVRWFRQSDLITATAASGHVQCSKCHSRMRQLRYVTAHNCGELGAMHTPKCPNCGEIKDMYLEDLGSFSASSWHCRSCGASIGTRFSLPCACGRYGSGGKPPFQRSYTARDQHLWYPQTITIINISNQTYDNLQNHPQRGVVAFASWIGDERNIAVSLNDLGRPSGGTRLSEAEWADQEQRLRASGISEAIIDDIRSLQGPIATGVGVVTSEVSDEVLRMASQRSMVERAALFDANITDDRLSFETVRAAASGTERLAADHTSSLLSALGIEDVSVTQKFPILLASYGYSRCVREPGLSDLRSYATPREYDGKTPIFVVPANTEALLISLDARAVLGFLSHEDLHAGTVPSERRSAQLALAELLATDLEVGGDGGAGTARRLVHSVSHALLRALDDGQSGFGESSLAEWFVPNALTTAIYVASYNDFTLGAFDTVLRRRLATWMETTAEAVNRCDNDPMCSQVSSHRPFAACDRCLHLSFGCRTWNADLDRRLLRRFWRWTQQRAVYP